MRKVNGLMELFTMPSQILFPLTLRPIRKLFFILDRRRTAAINIL
nr:MAG TPA: hypothetical protein [Caudoviricetes sp.]